MDTPNNTTHERILDIAEELFTKRGYVAVRLRDIADAVGIKHASLYYYAPEGKKQIFMRVMERNFKRHHEGITQAIQNADNSLRGQMYAVAKWLISQPPIEMLRMVEADSHELEPHEADYLMNLAYDSLRMPIVSALMRARQHGEIRPMDWDLAAMALISLVQSIHQIPASYQGNVRHQVALLLVDMLLDGWHIR